MLDQVDEESLDLVDEIIFDGGACKRVRQEALAFMMDHTEGFEVSSVVQAGLLMLIKNILSA